MKMIAEGVKTTHAALALGERHGVELPIATQMAAVLDGRSDVKSAVDALMVRRQKSETERKAAASKAGSAYWDKLSPEERLPLVLHFYLDMPMDEVARTLHVSPSAAKSRIYRAAKRLRSDLTLEEVF